MNNKYFRALALFVSITLFFLRRGICRKKTINITEQVNEVQFLPVNGTAISTNDILNDTVNIAFGKIRRENIVGSVSFINSEPILKKMTMFNLLLMRCLLVFPAYWVLAIYGVSVKLYL